MRLNLSEIEIDDSTIISYLKSLGYIIENITYPHTFRCSDKLEYKDTIVTKSALFGLIKWNESIRVSETLPNYIKVDTIYTVAYKSDKPDNVDFQWIVNNEIDKVFKTELVRKLINN